MLVALLLQKLGFYLLELRLAFVKSLVKPVEMRRHKAVVLGAAVVVHFNGLASAARL